MKKHQQFEHLVTQYGERLYALAYRLCGVAEVAEDLVQETFLEAWRFLSKLRDPQKEKSWIFKILRHRYYHWLRDKDRMPPFISLEEENSFVFQDSSPQVDSQCVNQDLLQKLLNSLEPRLKGIFLLVFLEGFTCQEVADEFSMPLGTILSRIHRARVHMRQAFKSDNTDRERVDTASSCCPQVRVIPFSSQGKGGTS